MQIWLQKIHSYKYNIKHDDWSDLIKDLTLDQLYNHHNPNRVVDQSSPHTSSGHGNNWYTTLQWKIKN